MFGSSGGMVTAQTPSSLFASATGGCAPIQFPESSTADALGAQSLKVTARSVPISGETSVGGVCAPAGKAKPSETASATRIAADRGVTGRPLNEKRMGTSPNITAC